MTVRIRFFEKNELIFRKLVFQALAQTHPVIEKGDMGRITMWAVFFFISLSLESPYRSFFPELTISVYLANPVVIGI